MASRGDEVEQRVDAVVPEAWVTLDARLLGQNIVVLALEVADNLGEAETISMCRTSGAVRRGPRLVVNLVAESRRVDNGQRYAGALLVEL